MTTEDRERESTIRVKLFAGLRELFGRNDLTVAAEDAPDVARLLELLSDSPERRRGLLDEAGAMREHLIVLRNGRSVGLLGGADAELSPGDEVAVFPPMGGG